MNRILPAFLLFTAVAFLSAAPPPEWGPWIPLKDGGKNGVEISFKIWPSKTQYFKIRNTYPVAVKVECQFKWLDDKGQSTTNSGCGATLAPGQERTDGGWFDFGVASVDTSSLVARVRRADNNASMGQAPVSPPRSGLQYVDCDDKPDDLEQSCNLSKLRCNEGGRQWCDQLAKSKGRGSGTSAYQEAYDACLSTFLTNCETSRAKCLLKIRRCKSGQACSGGFCVAR